MILIHVEQNALDSIAPMATNPHNITQSGQEPDGCHYFFIVQPLVRQDNA
jgi:hypothetical protein